MTDSLFSTTNSASPESGGNQPAAGPAIERMFGGRDDTAPARRERAAAEDGAFKPDTTSDLHLGDDNDAPEPKPAAKKPAEGKAKPAEGEEGEDEGETEEGETEGTEDEGEEGEGEDEDPEFEVEVETGKPEKLKLSGLVELAQKGKDYTKKTQELSEDRGVLERYATQSAADRKEVLDYARATHALITALVPSQAEWDAMKAKDPVAFIAAQEQWNAVYAKQKELLDGAAKVVGKGDEETARGRDLFIQGENTKLKADLPFLFDPNKGPKVKDRIFKYGEKIGYTKAELTEAVDSREIKTLYYAMRFMEIQEQRKGMEKPKPSAKPAPKPLPSTRPAVPVASAQRGPGRPTKTTRIVAAQKQLARSGKVEDAADAFTQMGF